MLYLLSTVYKRQLNHELSSEFYFAFMSIYHPFVFSEVSLREKAIAPSPSTDIGNRLVPTLQFRRDGYTRLLMLQRLCPYTILIASGI